MLMYLSFACLYYDSLEYNVRKMWDSFFHLFRVGAEWTSSKKMFSSLTAGFFLTSHIHPLSCIEESKIKFECMRVLPLRSRLIYFNILWNHPQNDCSALVVTITFMMTWSCHTSCMINSLFIAMINISSCMINSAAIVWSTVMIHDQQLPHS